MRILPFRLRAFGLVTILSMLWAVVPAALHAQPLQPQPWIYHQAMSHLERHESMQAIKLLDSLRGLSKVPSADLCSAYTLAYMQVRNYDSAAHYTDLLKAHHGTLYLLPAAQLNCYMGHGEEGMQYLHQYLQLKEKLSERRLNNDSLLKPCKNAVAWDTIWLSEWYTPMQRRIDEYDYRVEKGDWDYLLNLLDALPSDQRKRPQFAYYRALALRGKGQYAEALPLAEDAANHFPRRVECAVLTAELLCQVGKCSQAIKRVNSYQKGDPYEPAPLPILAQAYLGNTNYKQAYATARRYLSLYPKDLRCLKVAAEGAAKAKMWSKSLDAIADLLQRSESDTVTDMLTLRGSMLMELQDPQQAIVDLERALVRRPDDTTLLVLAARAYEKMSKRPEMCDCLLRAHKAGHPKAWIRLVEQCPNLRVAGQ